MVLLSLSYQGLVMAVSWDNLLETVEAWVPICTKVAEVVRPIVSQVFTKSAVGYYFNPETFEVGFFAQDPEDVPVATKVAELCGDTGLMPELTIDDFETGPWVKVAHSPLVRFIGENLNFIPGKFLGTVPNFASPLAGTLTTGLIGTGLGYGAGRLAQQFMPEGYGENLARTGAMLGGATGLGLGGAYMAHNAINGRSVLDPSPFREGVAPKPTAQEIEDFVKLPDSPHPESLDLPIQGPKDATPRGHFRLNGKTGSWKEAADAFGMAMAPDVATPADVHINSMGQVLWQSGASPQLTSATMGALQTASQFQTERYVPGYVMGDQLGQLGLHIAGDYAKGYAVGRALNALVGTPYRPSAFGAGAATLGVIGAVIPKLFGR